MESNSVRCGGADIFYEINGDSGPYLTLLHGNGEDRENFKRQIAYFKDKYRVISIDGRGHGESTFGGDKITLSLMADDLYNVLTHIKVPKTNILGFSDGANIAMIFALRHKERVDKLILAGGNINPGGMKLKFRVPVYLGYGLSALAAKFDKNAESNRDILGLMLKEPNIRPEELKSIQNPSIVIAGSDDMIKDSHTRLIADSLGNARLHIIDGADHFAVYKRHEEFNKIVGEFLEEDG